MSQRVEVVEDFELRTVIAATLGLAALYVAGCETAGSSSTSSPGSTSTTIGATASAAASATPDPTANWTHLSSRTGAISLRYDPAWSVAKCEPGTEYSWGTYTGDATSIFINSSRTAGSSPAGSAECPVENESPEMLIESIPISTTLQATPGPGACGANPPTTTQVTVNGVSGQRQLISYGSYSGCIGTPVLHEVRYTFTRGGRLYTLNYAYRQGDARDLTSEFDEMVQDTVTFAAS